MKANRCMTMRIYASVVLIYLAYSLIHGPGSARAQQEATPVPKDALAHIEQGEVFMSLKQANYEAALAEFERAYQLLDGHPRQCDTLYNIGVCHERLFRYKRALDIYDRYLTQCQLDAKDRAAAEQKVDVLRHLLGTLRISVNASAENVSAEVWVDQVLVGTAPGDLLVSGGRHTVELRAARHESAITEVTVTGGGIRELSFTLKEISEHKGISPVFFGTTAGLAVISAGLGTWFGVQALSQSGDAKEQPEKNTTKTEKQIAASATKADVFFATAGVLALGAGILYFLTDWGSEQKGPSTEQDKVQTSVVPMATPRGVAMQLIGSF